MYRRLCTAIGVARADRRSALQEPGRPLEEPQADERRARPDTSSEAERRADRGAQRAGVPSGPILNVKEVFENEQIRHLGHGPARRAIPSAARCGCRGLPAHALAHARRDSPRRTHARRAHRRDPARARYTHEEIATLRKDRRGLVDDDDGGNEHDHSNAPCPPACAGRDRYPAVRPARGGTGRRGGTAEAGRRDALGALRHGRPGLARSRRGAGLHHAVLDPVRAPRRAREADARQHHDAEPGRVVDAQPRSARPTSSSCARASSSTTAIPSPPRT